MAVSGTLVDSAYGAGTANHWPNGQGISSASKARGVGINKFFNKHFSITGNDGDTGRVLTLISSASTADDFVASSFTLDFVKTNTAQNRGDFD